ncbi:MAG: hypothetical protein QM674_08520 [Burkholderiaceae bacterium]
MAVRPWVPTTILAGAGAIATPATTVRALSGLAGISSGVGAELQQSYFSNLATQVIVPGIDLARADLRTEIASKRGRSISEYTLEAAIADAARYHGACSMNAGLEHSGKAVVEISNPGVRMLNATLGQMNLAQKLGKRLSDDSVEITEQDLRLADGQMLTAARFDRGSAFWSDGTGDGQPYLDKYLRSIEMIVWRLTTLSSNIKKVVGTCAASTNQDKKKCDYVAQMKAVIDDTNSTPKIATIVKLAQSKMTVEIGQSLAKVDLEIRQERTAQLGLEGQQGEAAALLAWRGKVLDAEKAYVAPAQIFDEIDRQLSQAQKAFKNRNVESLKSALQDIEKELKTIE